MEKVWSDEGGCSSALFSSFSSSSTSSSTFLLRAAWQASGTGAGTQQTGEA